MTRPSDPNDDSAPNPTEDHGRPITPDTPLTPSNRLMVDHWNGLRPSPAHLPARAAFDPVAVPTLLRGIWLVELIGTPPRYRVRLYGTRLAEGFGLDLTGRFLDEAPIGFADSAAEADFRAIAADGLPRWWRGAVSMTVPRSARMIEVVMLPLATDGRTVDMILSHCDIFPHAAP